MACTLDFDKIQTLSPTSERDLFAWDDGTGQSQDQCLSVNSSELESGENAGGPKALGSDNVGHKLLQMMGWQGGGLGAGGSGISEPITAQSFANREGLGTSNAGREFKARLRALIEEYAASSNPYDLVFTAGFDNEQRKELHK